MTLGDPDAETPSELIEEWREWAQTCRERGLNAEYHMLRDCADQLEATLDES